jgi:hypothetical protein
MREICQSGLMRGEAATRLPLVFLTVKFFLQQHAEMRDFKTFEGGTDSGVYSNSEALHPDIER